MPVKGRSADTSNVDRIIQFTLCVAGQEDFGEQELGPIHLIKYVYLADLAYAERHQGVTFTGVDWRFHNFGPWSVLVNDRISKATEAIRAERRTFESAKYDGEFVRYRKVDPTLLESLTRSLPGEILGSLKTAIHEHLSNTPQLLAFVYRTEPMLRAAPGEPLSFSAAEKADNAPEPEGAEEQPRESWKMRKARQSEREALKQRVRTKLAERRSQVATLTIPPPRYDETFFEGVRWLDSDNGDAPSFTSAEARFSEDIWKADHRQQRDVP